MPVNPQRLQRYYRGGKPAHLALDPSDVAPISLLPGDPGRVRRFAGHLRHTRWLFEQREYSVVRGDFEGVPVTVCSTGIGGPSTEIAVLELASLGVHTFIRVGGTGALREEIEPGTLVINTAMMRMGGTSLAYAPPEYPAVAHPEVLMSLIEAAAEEGVPYVVGIGGSTASYYQGQGRDLFATPAEQAGDAEAPGEDGSGLARFHRLGLLNLEMEADTILTLASLMGLRAGSILAVHVNRVTNRWDPAWEQSQERLIRVALRAVRILQRVDALRHGACLPQSVMRPGRFGAL